jgi:ribulose-5-phosphate 4-epimerase/fuculose-1-phosphate aldolase
MMSGTVRVMSSSETSADWEARRELAAAHRLADRADLAQGTWNHFTHRSPVDPARMWMTPPAFHWSLVRASDLIGLADDPSVAQRLGGDPTRAGYAIHYPLYELRPEVNCILHVHPPHATALGCVADLRLEAISQHAILLFDRISYTDEWEARARGAGDTRGAFLAEALDGRDILILRHHGVLVTGPSVAVAYTNLYLLEQCCRLQLLAMSTGRPTASVDEQFVQTPPGREDWKAESFAGLLRYLDATDPSYAE